MTRPRPARDAFTLVEILVAVGVVTVLAGLLLTGVQKARAAAQRTQCQNQLKQLGLALHQYHDARHRFPRGQVSARSELATRPARPDRRTFTGWTLPVLPYLEQSALHAEATAAFRVSGNPFADPPHVHRKTVVRAFTCPSDPRTFSPQTDPATGKTVALLSYLGVSGVATTDKTGMLFQNSRTKLTDASDGTSNTLLVGERPPSHDFRFGWWHSGLGQRATGSADLILGTNEPNLLPVTSGSACGPGDYPFGPAAGTDDPCGLFHFWSLHPGGGHFLFADGAVRFLPYSAADVLPALATRAGGEPAPAD
jgi:prepilin-type processing-associated H-X9-DG protein